VSPRASRPDPDEEALLAGYDPDLVLKGIEAAAGSWSDVDTDRLIEEIDRWREEGRRPADRGCPPGVVGRERRPREHPSPTETGTSALGRKP
jgi:hypothetical protein